jgi:hypothetical protein
MLGVPVVVEVEEQAEGARLDLQVRDVTARTLLDLATQPFDLECWVEQDRIFIRRKP